MTLAIVTPADRDSLTTDQMGRRATLTRLRQRPLEARRHTLRHARGSRSEKCRRPCEGRMERIARTRSRQSIAGFGRARLAAMKRQQRPPRSPIGAQTPDRQWRGHAPDVMSVLRGQPINERTRTQATDQRWWIVRENPGAGSRGSARSRISPPPARVSCPSGQGHRGPSRHPD
jgi:hypothetical protein